MKIKKIIYTTLLIIWMIIIFMFSNQNGNKSESTSDKVTSSVIDTVEVVTKHEVTEDEKNNLIEDTRLLVRKGAHFFLYFVLGIFSYLTFNSYGISRRLLLYSVLFCFIYAISDEIHQIFLDGRTAKFVDIIIDTAGASIGSLLVLVFKRCR